MELIAAVAAVALHGVVDGDDRGGHRLIADVDYHGVAHLDPARGSSADHEELTGCHGLGPDHL